MKQYNLSRLVSETESSLISYLASSLPVGNNRNQERLGERFFKLWEQQTFNGPYIESLPQYKVVKSLQEAVQMGQLGGREKDLLFSSRMQPKDLWTDIESRLTKFQRARRALWPDFTNDAASERERNTLQRLWDLRLYLHQEQSILKIIRQRQNVIVASGTGSGKTECFLIPSLYELLTEPDAVRSRPGVRALLLYPMNALVEDQMARLRRLLFWVNLQGLDAAFGERKLARPITFGRYTGETPVSPRDSGHDRAVSEEEIHELGEILYREDMQKSPPDVLVTNFTMLEYMLLRNDDRRLFQSPDLLKFLVLDEVHTYHGTRGMEVSTLLCRFRDYLCRSLNGREPSYVSIGLSATLSTEQKGPQKMARFASQIFGTKFEEASIVVGEAEPIKVLSSDTNFNPSRSLSELLKLCELTPGLCQAFAIDGAVDDRESDEITDEDWENLALVLEATPPRPDFLATRPERVEVLGSVLAGSPIFNRLKKCLEGAEMGVVSFNELAGGIFCQHRNKRYSKSPGSPGSATDPWAGTR